MEVNMKYYLAEACENTFVLVDALEGSYDPKRLFSEAYHYLMAENRDDALILSQGQWEGEYLCMHMLVLGQDGALGEFCGNGSRACAAYLYENYPSIKRFALKTAHGIHPLYSCGSGVYSIKLPPPSFQHNPKFIACPKKIQSEYHLHYVEMMEPHLIVQEEMKDEELLALGRHLNNDKALFPLGINVNACSLMKDGSLFVKTYERGVQRLTRSCGTGSVSCASLLCSSGHVRVTTPGGGLDIFVDEDGVELKGPAAVFDTDRKALTG